MAGQRLLVGSREQIFVFSWLLHAAFGFLNCLYLDPGVFPILFSPHPVLLRKRVIEQLAGHLTYSQVQPTTNAP